MWANLECGSLLPLSARLLAGALSAGSKLPAQKAGASSRTPYRRDFDVALASKRTHVTLCEPLRYTSEQLENKCDH